MIGWILGSVTRELHAGIVYAENAKMIWEDLKERFDKVNTSRIYQLHKDMVILSQGIDSVSTYFSKLRQFWAEFDSMTPPPCDCVKSKDFMLHIQRLKVMQFLMGLNENYEQARS